MLYQKDWVGVDLVLFLVPLLIASTPESAFDLVQLQDGFTKQLIASEPQVMDPVAFCFDDRGNILVAESFRQEQGVEDNRSSPFWLDWDLALQTVDDRLQMYEHFADQRINGMAYYSEFEDRIRVLQDEDGDGVFETSTLFANGFNDPLDGTGAGVLALGNTVYYTCIPHLWKIEDGKKRSMFGSSFGVRTALRGHDMHGLALGLDGRLYWSLGDRGYHIELADGTVLHSPGEGAVFRSELDGTDLEVYHHGLRNPQELAFDTYGNLFTGDNNSDATDKARLVYCVEGGETGWRMEYQTLQGVNERGPWVTENGWDPHATDRPAWILPAIDVIGSGPSGLVAYPGAGFDHRYDNHFFMCDFRGGAEYSNVLSFELEPEGAYFRMVDLHPFVEKVLCTDVDFGYNGKMVISDWGEGWTGNEEGRLYAVWDDKHYEEGDVSELFSIGFETRATKQLGRLLSHVDRRVRIRSQYELAHRGAIDELRYVLDTANQLGRLHAMWGIAMIARTGVDCQDTFFPLLTDPDDEIRTQACKILGELGYTDVFDTVAQLIDDPNPRVSYFATIGAGHLGDSFEHTLAMIERNNNHDVYLRHASVVALANSQQPSRLANLETHQSDAVRLAAVLALRKMGSDRISVFLHDTNDDVATEAARAIHDGRIDGAMDALANSLSVARTIPWQKRAISANKMNPLATESERVAAFAADVHKPQEMRLLALQALLHWNPANELGANRDIVEGRVLPQVPTNGVQMGDVLSSIHTLLDHASGALLLSTLQFASANRYPLPKHDADALVLDETMPVSIRVFALQQAADPELLSYALEHECWELRATARDILFANNAANASSLLLEAVQSGELYEAQAAMVTLANDQETLSTLNRDALPAELQLEYAKAKGDPLLFGDPLKGWWLLRGGNPEKGRAVVYNNPRSQCLRCHTISGTGGIAGPTLDGIADRLTERELQEALLAPNSDVADGFGEYSAMPPMGVLLDHVDLRDVIAYLKTLKAEQQLQTSP